jgi:outer membrane protein OmpA-like peptidoglycan-associated protein
MVLQDSSAQSPRSWRERLQLRSWRLWALVAIALYTVLGFFVAPRIVRSTLPDYLGELIDREVVIERARINPYVLSAELRGLRVVDELDEPALSIDVLYVNFQLSSLFHRAWTFAEIALTVPYFEFIRYADGTHSVARLRAPTSAEPAAASAPPRLIVHRLTVQRGRMDFIDRTLPSELKQEIGPIDFELTNLSTLPERTADNDFVARTPQGTELRWRGELTLEPLASSGHLALVRGQLPVVAHYFETYTDFALLSGRADFELDYQVGYEAAEVRARFDAISGSLADINIAPEVGEGPTIELPRIDFANVSVAWPDRRVAADRFVISDARVEFGIASDGTIDLIEYAMPRATTDGAAPGGDPASVTQANPVSVSAVDAGGGERWQFGIGELALQRLAVELVDARPADPFRGGVDDLNLTVREISSEVGARFPIELEASLLTGGHISSNGEIGVSPLAADLEFRVDGLELPPAQPYLRQRAAVDLSGGRVNFEGHLGYAADTSLQVTGNGAVEALSMQDLLRGERFVAWDTALLENLDVDMGRSAIALDTLRLNGPFMELRIAEDGTTNLGDVFSAGAEDTVPPAAEPPAEPSRASALAIRIARIEIAAGTAGFADRSLPVPFATGIYDLEGSIRDTDTTSDIPSTLALQGRVDENGELRAEGSLKLLAPTRALDVNAQFRNLDLPLLTPYSAKFAGYRIAEGKLSLDLDYVMADERLQGENNIVVEQLVLGAPVDSPSALDLPIKLAIGLLTDSSGRIDLDLPVSGSLEDPEFSIGSMLGGVLGGIVRDAVTSPFRFLGGLIGAGSEEEISDVDFAVGSAELAPPEREKLARLAEALRERPLLLLTIAGQYAPESDARALKEAGVDARVETALESTAGETRRPQPNPRLAVLEALFLEEFPAERLSALQAESMIAAQPATGETEAVPARLDELALANALRAGLIESFELPEQALRDLATSRARAAAEYLTVEAALPASRLTILEAQALEGDSPRVPLRLDLAATEAAAAEGA